MTRKLTHIEFLCVTRWRSKLLAFIGLLALALGNSTLAVAQVPTPTATPTPTPIPTGDGPRDNRGTEFMLGFMENLAGTGESVALFITGDVATSGIVEIPGLGFSSPFAVTPGTVTSVALPLAARASGSDVVATLGVRVAAGADIVVYGLNQRQATTDAFLGLPIDILGTEHIVLGFEALTTGIDSEFLIVGVQDGTTVTITPSISTGIRVAGVPYQITLDRFDTYQLKSDLAAEDVSGSIVQSDLPVAVFGGGQCVNVPIAISACDHIVEQLPPTETWGVSFLTVPLATRTAGDLFRVIARDAGTEVRIDGVLVATLARAAFYEADLPSGTFHEIDATAPVMVMQYSKGTSADNVTSDPFMMMIPPTEQFLRTYTLTTPAALPVSFTNYINVAVDTLDVASCMIDGAPFSATFSAIGTSGFSAAQQPVSIGSHVVSCPRPFGAYAYGFADADSYGYPGGLALESIAEKRVALTPDQNLDPLGASHTITARVTLNVIDPVVGREVTFNVTSGPNINDTGSATTDENGEASFTYTGDGGIGADEIVATCLDDEEVTIFSSPALQFWDADCNENGIADTCDVEQFGFGERCFARRRQLQRRRRRQARRFHRPRCPRPRFRRPQSPRPRRPRHRPRHPPRRRRFHRPCHRLRHRLHRPRCRRPRHRLHRPRCRRLRHRLHRPPRHRPRRRRFHRPRHQHSRRLCLRRCRQRPRRRFHRLHRQRLRRLRLRWPHQPRHRLHLRRLRRLPCRPRTSY